MKKVFLSSLLFFIAFQCFAQEILLKQKVNRDFIKPKFGPNLMNYVHAFSAAGVIAGQTEKNGDIDFLHSGARAIGARYKFKVTNHYAIGADVYVSQQEFGIKQYEYKLLPDKYMHKSQNLKFYSLGLAVYNRINIDRYRGNYIGKYIDLGVDYLYNFGMYEFTQDKLEGKSVKKTKRSGLSYYNPSNIFFTVRAGMNRYSIFVKYRYDNLFKSSAYFPELPRFIAGIELGLF